MPLDHGARECHSRTTRGGRSASHRLAKAYDLGARKRGQRFHQKVGSALQIANGHEVQRFVDLETVAAVPIAALVAAPSRSWKAVH